MKYFIFFTCLFIFNIVLYSAEVETFRYSFNDNYVGWVMKNKDVNAPVVIYVPDQNFYTFGHLLSVKHRYDVTIFMKLFHYWGYTVFVPVEGKLTSFNLRGIYRFITTSKGFNHTNIHLVAHSKNALLSFMTLNKMSSVKSLTLISPAPGDDTGFLSLPSVVRRLEEDKPKIPIFLLYGNETSKKQLKFNRILKDLFKQHKLDFSYEEYPANHRWFWNTKHKYLLKVYTFLTGKKWREINRYQSLDAKT